MSKAHIRPEVLVSHGNARTTVHGRKLIVDRHPAGWGQAHIAAAMSISRKWVRAWIRPLSDRGRGPTRGPLQPPVAVPATGTARRTRSSPLVAEEPAGGQSLHKVAPLDLCPVGAQPRRSREGGI